MDNLHSKVKTATKWSTLTEVTAKIISPIINMILARLLAPEAFGVVASITMITSFADIFADAGFQKYLVQQEFKTQKDLNDSTTVAFWTNLFISVVIYIVIYSFRNQIARIIGNEDLGRGISVASLVILMTSFSSIQMARYRRMFDFRTLFIVRIISSLIPFFITIPLAFLMRNYWALLIGVLASNLFQAVFLTIRSKWKPNFYYSLDNLRKMLAFSFWSLLEALSIWFTSYMGTFVVGYYLNAYYLGLYKTSITTVNSYMTIITGSTTSVLFSALSRLKDNKEEYEKTFFKFQRMVAMFVLPMGVGLFLYRGLATRILLGSKWSEAKDFIGLWAFMSGVSIVFSHYNSEVFRSKGKPKLSLLSQILHLAVLIPVLVISSRYGFRVLYIARSLVRLQAILVGQLILWFNFKISFIKIVKNVAPTIAASFFMGVFSLILRLFSNSIIWEFVSIFFCVLIYFAIILSIPSIGGELLEIKAIRKVLNRLKFFRKKGRNNKHS